MASTGECYGGLRRNSGRLKEGFNGSERIPEEVE